jgi:hypothetical protein
MRYDLFEVEEGVGFFLRIIFDPFEVHEEDSGGVIPYQRDLTPSGSTVMTLKGSYPTQEIRPLRGRRNGFGFIGVNYI